jgi:hypothetical protein
MDCLARSSCSSRGHALTMVERSAKGCINAAHHWWVSSSVPRICLTPPQWAASTNHSPTFPSFSQPTPLHAGSLKTPTSWFLPSWMADFRHTWILIQTGCLMDWKLKTLTISSGGRYEDERGISLFTISSNQFFLHSTCPLLLRHVIHRTVFYIVYRCSSAF